MAQNKTVETEASVTEYINTIADEEKRKDCAEIIKLFAKATGLKPKMWGPAIVGFGSYHYRYESGREGDAPLTGLAARVNAITLYLSSDFEKKDELLKKFGKHKTSKACIYIQKLGDVDKDVLHEMVVRSVEHTRSKYPT
jgi:nucleoid DNA-binding protein